MDGQDVEGPDVDEEAVTDGAVEDPLEAVFDEDLPTRAAGNLPTVGETRDLTVPPDTTDDGNEEIRQQVLAEVLAYFGSHSLDEAIDDPTEEFIYERWFDFDYLARYEEVERYWVNKPYAYISLLYNPRAKEFRYHVTEPVLNEVEQYVRDDLIRILRNSLMYTDLEEGRSREETFTAKAVDAVVEHAAAVDDGTVHKLLYFLLRDFVDFGKIDALMRDPNIEDISCDGVDVPVFVYHRTYRDLRTNVSFEDQRLNSFTVRLAQRAGKQISVSDPLVDASLPDGSRIQLTLGGDVSTRGSNFTIRKFSEVPYTPIDLINWNTFSVEQMAYFWLAIENNKSLVFAGGTGSGKTTSLNAVSFFIPPDSKVVSIEDTREITLPHENWVQSTTRGAVTAGGRGEVTTYQLLQAALRQRPEYLLVGEIRTEQRVALTFFQAIGTGHTSYTTIHADSIESALSRLENPPLSVPAQMLQGLDVISIQRQLMLDDTRVRRNVQVTELGAHGDDPNAITTNDVFERDPRTDSHEQVGDSHVLASIADQRGWSETELVGHLEDREAVLEYLVGEDITDYDAVAAVIHTFARDPDYVLEHIDAGDLEPADLPIRSDR